MNAHQNARTTPHIRALIVCRREAGEPIALIARPLGVSSRTVYKWLKRHAQEGLDGLQNRSSRPHRHGMAYASGWLDLIARLRRYRMTALEIAEHLGFPRSTVAYALKGLRLNRLSRLTPPRPVLRYERKSPGDLIHLDIKRLNRFHAPGHRVTGDRRLGKSKGAGWEYVHVCIDDHSRLAYVEVLADEKGLTCAGFLARATQWFARKGITVRRVMTDNGVGYISGVFRDCTLELNQRHIRTKPYTPQTNGKAERFIKTMLEEWAYFLPYKSSDRRTADLPRWVDHYNCHRKHAAIDMKPPISRIPAQT